MGLSGTPAIEVRWDFATTRDADVSFAMSSQYEAWDPALAVLERVAPEAATLSTVYALADWSSAFAAVERRTVIKAVIDPRGLDGDS